MRLQPDRGPSDIDRNTIAFAVLLVNDDSVADRNWRNAVIPINDELTGDSTAR
ncbi:hypothetical protein [Rubidibacter lacunae]|uniref:hypothetical protein n=1 Tax=Rubidibacter lacunae TaxID=582514 RepID=UPI0003FCDD63|nr:hypothetical protein [Rubidibacter lacunae]